MLELLVLLDQHWNYSRLKFPICLLSRTGREMLTFVRSMMEWLGGTISKEDVGETGTGGKQNKRRRDDDDNDDALGAFALRFPFVISLPMAQNSAHRGAIVATSNSSLPRSRSCRCTVPKTPSLSSPYLLLCLMDPLAQYSPNSLRSRTT